MKKLIHDTFGSHRWYYSKKSMAFSSPSERRFARERGIPQPDFLPWYVAVYKCKCGKTKKVYRQAFTHLGVSPKEIELT